jgi:aspartate aminotransferase
MENLSNIGQNIVGSEIIKIAQKIKSLPKEKEVANLTIGDFDPNKYPIPESLTKSIIQFYNDGFTNYPLSQGELSLRNSVSSLIKDWFGVLYNPSDILVGAGVRPLIYTVYKTIVNPGEGVIYPVPSWNNNHYTFLTGARHIPIECSPENSFFPTPEDILKVIDDTTTLISLCSPQNPTGRIIPKETLTEICELVVEENVRRVKLGLSRPLYLFFDQIYSALASDPELFIHPVNLCPEIRKYLICVDGISKSINATGVRVGWLFADESFVKRATEVFSHIGAWAPKPEQLAVAKLISDHKNEYRDHIQKVVDKYRDNFERLYECFENLKMKGYDVDYQKSEGAIYISIYLGYAKKVKNLEDYLDFLVGECSIGIVPFEYFGSKTNRGWFRISVGGVDESNIQKIIQIIESAVEISHKKFN